MAKNTPHPVKSVHRMPRPRSWRAGSSLGAGERELIFPTWFSRWILLNLDAHELHHMYASVPGYHLHRLRQPTPNAIPWWLWLWRAKQIRGEILLFHNRDETGFLI